MEESLKNEKTDSLDNEGNKIKSIQKTKETKFLIAGGVLRFDDFGRDI